MQKATCVVEHGIRRAILRDGQLALASAQASYILRNFVDYKVIVSVRSVFKDFFKTLFVKPLI